MASVDQVDHGSTSWLSCLIVAASQQVAVETDVGETISVEDEQGAVNHLGDFTLLVEVFWSLWLSEWLVETISAAKVTFVCDLWSVGITRKCDFCSREKTKLMTNNTKGISLDVRIGGQKLETVQSFKYLGSVVTDEGSKQEILSRIAHTIGALTKLKTIWKDKNIALSSKIRLMRSLVISIFLYV